MIPDHCRHVSIHEVDFELEPEIIKQKLLDTKIYKGTDYLVLKNHNNWAVVRVGKTPQRGLFWLIKSVEIISPPKNTIFHNDTEVNVLNINDMASISQKFPKKTVVVRGKFEHVSFIIPEPAIEITALEVVPPYPPKVITLANDMLKFKSFSKPILVTEKIIDIKSYIKKDTNMIYTLPCRASGLPEDDNIQFLDENPKLKPEENDSITLIGCDLSLRIFKEIYNFEPKFTNICPLKFAKVLPKNKPILIKCCAAKSFERKDNLYIVPWGATYNDIEMAFKELTK